uniref:Uncharacterized protein n=1 Tax=Oryza punctata TaxID=4537 RepID=A0A0E0KCP7_ORYPU
MAQRGLQDAQSRNGAATLTASNTAVAMAANTSPPIARFTNGLYSCVVFSGPPRRGGGGGAADGGRGGAGVANGEG